MANNYFLTGPIRVGKTTIILKLLDRLNLNPGGFFVGRAGKDKAWLKFYFIAAELYKKNRFNISPADKAADNKVDKKLIFAYREDRCEKWVIRTEVFNNMGVELLENGICLDIVIMDELGNFEKRAKPFQDKVQELLDSNVLVLGVLKDADNPFLNLIKERSDLILTYVSKENRESVMNDYYHRLKKII